LASFAGIFVWWLLSVVLAVLAWPLTYRLFRFLPDRGLGLSRLVGWLFTGYVAWVLGFAFNHALMSVAAFTLLGLLGWNLYQGRRQEHHDFLRAHSGLIFVYELAFFTLFFVWCVVRMKHSNIEGQEKFMDFAFFNSCIHSVRLPPMDPWLAAPHNYINYYYFGYFLNAAFARLTLVGPDIAYNLAVSNNFALCGVALLSMGYNLTLALWPGLVGMASLLVLGNLHGALQVLGIQWNQPFSWWEPTRMIKDVAINGHYLNRWWWSADPAYLASIGAPANAAQDGLISEFPAFSFLHGDLHPHFTNLPLTLLVLALGLNLVKDPSPAPLRLTGRFDAAAQGLLALVLALGAVLMGNTWDLPAYGLLASLLLLGQQHAGGHLTGKTWASQWLLPSALLLAGLVLAAGPFLAFFQNPAHGFGLHGARTGLRDTLVFWGVFLAVLLPFTWLSLRALAEGAPGAAKPPPKAAKAEPKAMAPARACPSCGAKLRQGKELCGQCGARWEAPVAALPEPALLAPPAWAVAWARLSTDPKRAFQHPSVKLGAPLLALAWLACAWAWPTAAVFSALAGASALVLLARGGSREALFTASLTLVGSLLVLLCEFGYLRDVFEGNPALTRMNTVFKFYFQAWVLFSAALPYAVWWTLQRLRRGSFAISLGYSLALGALVLGALVYPAKAIGFVWDDWDRWSRLEPSLDGAAWMQRDMPADYAAIMRLREAVSGQPVIVEAAGGAYTHYARVSAYTGFRAVVGWGNHESQWRKDWPTQQEHDVDELYTTLDLGRAKQLLDQYQVEYVVVGQMEREKYGSNPAALDKFAQLGAPVVQEQGTVVYRVNR
jgi:uncharacterized membrane protein